MTTPPVRFRLPRSVRLGMTIALLAALGTGAIVWYQVNEEYRTSVEDLDRRAGVLLHRTTPAARSALELPDDQIAKAMGERLEGHSRLLGFALFRPDGRYVAGGEAVADLESTIAPIVARIHTGEPEVREVVRSVSGTTHVLASMIAAPDGAHTGTLVVLHDALYLEDRLTRGMVRGLALALSVAGVLFVLTSGLAWALFERPMHALAEWMRKLRFGGTQAAPPPGLPLRRLEDESAHLAASFRAARSQERESADTLTRSDKTWTRERLRAHARSALGDTTLVVVSNREPYMHQFADGRPKLVRPASGLVTGLDPVLQACGGLWVAHGAGDADRATVDANACVSVPPDDPRYTLRRVWITKEEEEGYYYGFSNEGLWPLCHLTHERPIFRASDWDQYVNANQRFADAVLNEVGAESAVVMVQDYQVALVPAMIKQRRPDLRVGLFWHIPWPNPEAFRICPFRAEVLQGMLGADLIGFHLQQHCNNFLDTVDRMVEAKLDWDRFSVELRGSTTLVRPFPISVQPWSEKHVASGDELAARSESLRHKFSLANVPIAVGVDRIDYTKGIAERFRAIERFFERCPQHRGQFSFVQLGAPSRTHIPRYRDLVTELETLADAINWRFKADNQGWKPIHFLVAHHDEMTVHAFLKMASVCIVSSLHDGMNLVAKEFIAAQGEPTPTGADGDGVLILSEFAGAARDLPDALIINPYDTEEFAEAIRIAVEMPGEERRARMSRLYQQVSEHNIYRWAAEFLTALTQAKTNPSPKPVEPATRA
ncbi:MAG: trehalose-6-phosphate synthase [Planctomycetes bacterium]|nr:trehalose-6-phosphate synthase [Planctomycetota bacterium]